MPDWRGLIRRRLAGLDLRPVDEIDIVEELAQHVEDRYTDLCQGGASEEDALNGSLEELDGETLATEMLEVLGKKGPSLSH
jgi:hypothetical protein